MSISLLGALIVTNPEAAKAFVLDAMRKAKGHRGDAAKALGTTKRSLYRAIERLDLWTAIDDLGFVQAPGPKRSPQKFRLAILAANGDLDGAAKSLGVTREFLEMRLTELKQWADINRLLRAANLRPLVPPAKVRV